MFSLYHSLVTFIQIITESGKGYACHNKVFNSQGCTNNTHSLISTGTPQNLSFSKKTITNGKGSFCSSQVDCFFLAITINFPQPVSSIRKIVLSPIYPFGNFQERCELPILTKNESKENYFYFYLGYYLQSEGQVEINLQAPLRCLIQLTGGASE